MAEEKFGKFGALMAMTGSAVGLGCLWRFPFQLGQNGGAAFLLLFILCTIVVALPLFAAEFIIGRRSGKDCYGAFDTLAPGTKWRYAGLFIITTPVIVSSYYSVIGGWSVQYLCKAFAFNFSGADVTTEQLGAMFENFSSSIWPPIICHTVFIGAAACVLIVGVKKGIEKFGKIAMPALAVIIIVIAVYVAILPGAAEGYRYLFQADFSKITLSTVLAAMGQAFYSLSLGVGCIMTYSSYIKKKDSIHFHSFGTAGISLMFAVIAACAFVPAVFAFGQNPSAGPSLVFETLPFIFSRMPGGDILAILFFIGLIAAALTSIISMLEVEASYLIEEKKMKRRKAVFILSVISWGLGCLCSLSFGPLADIRIAGFTIFSFADAFSTYLMLPVGALASVIFVGWKLKKEDFLDEFTSGGAVPATRTFSNIVYFSIRYVVPVAIVIILIGGLLTF